MAGQPGYEDKLGIAVKGKVHPLCLSVWVVRSIVRTEKLVGRLGPPRAQCGGLLLPAESKRTHTELEPESGFHLLQE